MTSAEESKGITITMRDGLSIVPTPWPGDFSVGIEIRRDGWMQILCYQGWSRHYLQLKDDIN
jgi:hypothetical protein